MFSVVFNLATALLVFAAVAAHLRRNPSAQILRYFTVLSNKNKPEAPSAPWSRWRWPSPGWAAPYRFRFCCSTTWAPTPSW